MFEKVNPSHPDKIADRIAGAIVDLAYSKEANPKVAVEVLIGHGLCTIINETSVKLTYQEVAAIVVRIAGTNIRTRYIEQPQDAALAENQKGMMRCGDNGIFKGCPITLEQAALTHMARTIYDKFPYDGKYLIDKGEYIICQSHAENSSFHIDHAKINPLGYWTGGLDVDCGATNRKLGSDLGDAATGGGLHGKDLSKADVSLTIYAHMKALQTNSTVELKCAIGDEYVDGRPYWEIVEEARRFIQGLGGFEKLAEWGLIR